MKNPEFHNRANFAPTLPHAVESKPERVNGQALPRVDEALSHGLLIEIRVFPIPAMLQLLDQGPALTHHARGFLLRLVPYSTFLPAHYRNKLPVYEYTGVSSPRYGQSGVLEEKLCFTVSSSTNLKIFEAAVWDNRLLEWLHSF
jgi:hypothetical protein